MDVRAWPLAIGQHDFMRQLICDELEKGDHEVDRMRKPKEWGTERELLAAPNVLRVNILVWAKWTTSFVWYEFRTTSGSGPSIYLNNESDNHFDVAHKV